MLSFSSAIHQTLLPTPLWYKYGLCDQTSGYFSLTCSWLTGGAAAVVKCLARDPDHMSSCDLNEQRAQKWRLCSSFVSQMYMYSSLVTKV